MPRKTITEVTFDKAQAACKAIDSELRVPDIDELAACFINRSLLTMTSGDDLWSGSRVTGSSTLGWAQVFNSAGDRASFTRSLALPVRCVYK